MASRSVLVRSLNKSTEIPIQTAIKGTIPKWLNGTLYRNGPGKFEFNGKFYNHLFDGQACVHKFAIKDGAVFYSNKLLETQSYIKSSTDDRLYPYFDSATHTKVGLIERLQKFMKSPEYFDNANINVLPFGKRHLYALTEANRMCRLNPKDLSIISTTNVTEFFPDLKHVIAHAHIEKDGGWINCGISVKKGKPHYTVVKYKGIESNSAHEQAKIIAEIPSKHHEGYSYFHSFAVTDNYVILLESSLKLSLKRMMKAILFNKPSSTAFTMDDSFSTKIHVVNKHTGEVLPQKFFTDPQFTFHHINAYEKIESENNLRLMIDISSYDTTFTMNNFALDRKKLENTEVYRINYNSKSAYAKRIEIPVNLKETAKNDVYCTMKHLNENFSFEFPQINYFQNNGRNYRYVFGTNQNFSTPVSVIKMDVQNPLEIKEHVFSLTDMSIRPNEPIFVPNPNAESEDDGVLLVMCLSTSCDFISILDARDLKEIARADLPQEVKGSFTFHGFFAEDRMYKALNV